MELQFPTPPGDPPPPMLAYAVPQRRGRPGIITAIGVMSIVIGSLSALYSLQSAAGGAMFLFLSRLAARSSGARVTATSSTSGTITYKTSSTSTVTRGTASSTRLPATGPSTAPAFAAGPGFTAFPRVPAASCVLVAVEGVLSLGLAVWLLVIGILTLRQSRRAPRHHRIWAWLKMPLSVIGGFAYASMMIGVIESSAAMAQPGRGLFFAFYAGMVIVLGCAYPVGLLITLRSKAVQAYYHSIVAS